MLVKFDLPIERFDVFQTLSLIPFSKKKKIKPKEVLSNYTDISFVLFSSMIEKTVCIANYFITYVRVMHEVFIVH